MKRMNNRGQTGMMGALLLTFVAVIVGLVLLTAVSPFIGETTNTQDVANDTITAAAENETVNLKGRAVEGSVTVLNSTDDDVSDQFTVLNNQIDDTTGELTAQLQTDAGASEAGNSVNVSYTYQPTGYIDSAGGRSMTSLILIFMAIAIFVVALQPTLRNGLLDMIQR